MSHDFNICAGCGRAVTNCECAMIADAECSGKTAQPFDLRAHLVRQIAFSRKTFGPGFRTAGIIDHIKKELNEVAAKPNDVNEWIDVIILGFDGAWRSGHSEDEIIAALVAKQTRNESRSWPDWRTAAPDKAIEHVRTDELIVDQHAGVLGVATSAPTFVPSDAAARGKMHGNGKD